MSDTTAMVPVNLDQLPSTQIGTDDQFAELAKGGDYIGRMQLYTKSKANMKGLIPQGHYGIPESDEEIIDLGTSVDLLPLARRPKAIDMTDMEALVISYDMESEEFKRIAGQVRRVRFALPVRPHRSSSTSGAPAASWSSSAATSRAASRRRSSFPSCRSPRRTSTPRRRPAMTVGDLKPHGPIPVTLKVKVAENRKGTWHVPVVVMCSTPFTRLPSDDVIVREINKFLTVKDNGVEKVQDSKPARAR